MKLKKHSLMTITVLCTTLLFAEARASATSGSADTAPADSATLGAFKALPQELLTEVMGHMDTETLQNFLSSSSAIRALGTNPLEIKNATLAKKTKKLTAQALNELQGLIQTATTLNPHLNHAQRILSRFESFAFEDIETLQTFHTHFGAHLDPRHCVSFTLNVQPTTYVNQLQLGDQLRFLENNPIHNLHIKDRHGYLHNLDFRDLIPVLTTPNNPIASLNIGYLWIENWKLLALIHALPQTAIKDLNLSQINQNVSGIDLNCFQRLGTTLPSTVIKTLNVYQTNMMDAHLMALTTGFTPNGIEEFHVGSNPDITEDGYRTFFTALRQNQSCLHTLNVSSGTLNQAHAEVFRDTLPESVTSLNLHRALEDTAISPFIERVAHHKHLRHLNLNENNLGDEAGAAFVRALQGHPLESLSLVSTNIGDATVTALSNWLQTADCPLQVLSLSSNYGINDQMTHMLLESAANSRLTLLNIDETSIGREDTFAREQAAEIAQGFVSIMPPVVAPPAIIDEIKTMVKTINDERSPAAQPLKVNFMSTMLENVLKRWHAENHAS